MTKQVQRRRGTDTQHTSFTGAEGELSVNTSNNSIHVHDGSTAGGIETARADLGNVSDADLNSALTGNTLSSLTITSADINGGTIDGTVIGGTTPAAGNFTGIDVTGTVTADGLTVSSTDNVSITQTHTDGNVVTFTQSGTGGDIDWRNANGDALIRAGAANRLLVDANGDISFYEDTGTTPKFFWDASTERLGIGNAAPATALDVTGTVTADGLTVNKGSDGSDIVSLTGASAGRYLNIQSFTNSGAAGAGYDFNATSGQGAIQLSTAGKARLKVNNNGDISFYEYTGTTPALTWDASAQSLNVDGPITADGLTVDGSATLQSTAPILNIVDTDGQSGRVRVTSSAMLIEMDPSTAGVASNIQFKVDNKQFLNIDDSGDISFYEDTGTTPKFFWDASAEALGIGTSTPSNPLDVNADSIRVRTAQTPATASAAGNQGEIAWDADYIYVCTATNTWKRTALTTW